MNKLLDHFTAMQEMATRFITPEVYVARDGLMSAEENKRDNEDLRRQLFISDMIYMMDGPEQRAAAEDVFKTGEAWKSQVADLEETTKHQVNRIAFLASEVKAALARVAPLEAENNDLRSRLMDSELAYAKLVGYLEGKRDSEPVPLMPVPRESYLARVPDGSEGAASGRRWDTGGSMSKSWYHR